MINWKKNLSFVIEFDWLVMVSNFSELSIANQI